MTASKATKMHHHAPGLMMIFPLSWCTSNDDDWAATIMRVGREGKICSMNMM